MLHTHSHLYLAMLFICFSNGTVAAHGAAHGAAHRWDYYIIALDYIMDYVL